MKYMFDFITETYNPLGGRCPHGCVYCYASGKGGIIEKWKMPKYQGEPKLWVPELNRKRKFEKGAFVFVCDMCDLFAETVADEDIEAVLQIIRENPQARFLLLTKNPERYLNFLDNMPTNAVLGATIETDLPIPLISEAPNPHHRLECMLMVSWKTKNLLFISIEPIIEFHLASFSKHLIEINPWAVAIGSDNHWKEHGHKLPEPALWKTKQLIKLLRGAGIPVFEKTLREAHWRARGLK